MMRPRRLITPLMKSGARGTWVISVTRMISCTSRTSTPYSSRSRKNVARCSVASTALRSSRAGAAKNEMLWARGRGFGLGGRGRPARRARAPARPRARRPPRPGPGCPRRGRRTGRVMRAAPRGGSASAGKTMAPRVPRSGRRRGAARRGLPPALAALACDARVARPWLQALQRLAVSRPCRAAMALALEEGGHVEDQDHAPVAHDGGARPCATASPETAGSRALITTSCWPRSRSTTRPEPLVAAARGSPRSRARPALRPGRPKSGARRSRGTMRSRMRRVSRPLMRCDLARAELEALHHRAQGQRVGASRRPRPAARR